MLAARTLLLVSKVLINLANHVEFGLKEPYMEPLNDFIRPNLNAARAFITSLASSPYASFAALGHRPRHIATP